LNGFTFGAFVSYFVVLCGSNKYFIPLRAAKVITKVIKDLRYGWDVNTGGVEENQVNRQP
jgi:hypothetical protein